MIWIILLCIVGFISFRFFNDLNKDSYDLQGQTLAEKFMIIVESLNEAVYHGLGSVTPIDKRSFNLYKDGSNQIILFLYSTGHLTITWKYKYFQKEVVHEKQFNDVRNLSLFEQQKIADLMIMEMSLVIEKHQNNVIGDI